MTLTGLPNGIYVASLRQSGDISEGVKSMGGIYTGLELNQNGRLGRLRVGDEGRGTFTAEINWKVWEMVGRGIVVERMGEKDNREKVVVGVVARSAGVWENDKVVCGCSGQTVWAEREEMAERGML